MGGDAQQKERLSEENCGTGETSSIFKATTIFNNAITEGPRINGKQVGQEMSWAAEATSAIKGMVTGEKWAGQRKNNSSIQRRLVVVNKTSGTGA